MLKKYRYFFQPKMYCLQNIQNTHRYHQEQFEGHQQQPNSTMLSIDYEAPNRQVDTSPTTNQPQPWDTTESYTEHPQHPVTSSEPIAPTTHTSQLKDTLQRLLTHIQNKSHSTPTHDNNSQDELQDP